MDRELHQRPVAVRPVPAHLQRRAAAQRRRRRVGGDVAVRVRAAKGHGRIDRHRPLALRRGEPSLVGAHRQRRAGQAELQRARARAGRVDHERRLEAELLGPRAIRDVDSVAGLLGREAARERERVRERRRRRRARQRERLLELVRRSAVADGDAGKRIGEGRLSPLRGPRPARPDQAEAERARADRERHRPGAQALRDVRAIAVRGVVPRRAGGRQRVVDRLPGSGLVAVVERAERDDGSVAPVVREEGAAVLRAQLGNVARERQQLSRGRRGLDRGDRRRGNRPSRGRRRTPGGDPARRRCHERERDAQHHRNERIPPSRHGLPPFWGTEIPRGLGGASETDNTTISRCLSKSGPREWF